MFRCGHELFATKVEGGMGADEYLENALKEAFTRELEVDENVARTLPFFATSLALAATLYGYGMTKLPPPALSVFSCALHGLLVFGAFCLMGVLYSMVQTVRLREYRIPPKEPELIAWAASLREYFRGQGLTPATVEKRTLAQIRDRMIVEYAESASHNREANAPKLKARAQGFTLLVLMLFIAFVMIATIFVKDRMRSVTGQGERDVSIHETAAAGATGRSEQASGSAPVPGDPGGREVPRGAGRQHGPTQAMSDSQGNRPPPAGTAPATQPPSVAPSAGPPPAPAHQVLKKSESGGGPIERR